MPDSELEKLLHLLLKGQKKDFCNRSNGKFLIPLCVSKVLNLPVQVFGTDIWSYIQLIGQELFVIFPTSFKDQLVVSRN